MPNSGLPALESDNDKQWGRTAHLISVDVIPLYLLVVLPGCPIFRRVPCKPLCLTTNTISFATLLSTVVGILVLYGVKALLTRKTPLGPLPPGPRSKPILGNISDLPPPGEKD